MSSTCCESAGAESVNGSDRDLIEDERVRADEGFLRQRSFQRLHLCPIEDQPKYPDRLRDVLDALLAEIFEAIGDPPHDVIVHAA
jgi:hypothetical protein